MTTCGAYQPHKGLAVAALTPVQPITALVFGPVGAARVRAVCRAYIADPGTPQDAPGQLDGIDSLLPELGVDAAGPLDDVLAEPVPGHSRRAAFFHGHCRSRHHPAIEVAIRSATGIETLDAALARALNMAIDAGERLVADGHTDATDRLRMRHVNAPLARLPAAARNSPEAVFGNA